VNLKTASQAAAGLQLSVVVDDADTVASTKERVASLQQIPFPEQDLMLDGEVLEDKSKLADCGVKDSSSIDLVIRASEASLVKQLSDLLQARDLSCDELGLLYCYKHGVSVGQALKMVGRVPSLQDFIKNHKAFQVENNTVALIRDTTPLKPFSVTAEVEQILKAHGGSMDIKDLCTKFVQKFNVNLSSIVGGMKPQDYLARETELFIVNSRGQVSLKHATKVLNAPRSNARNGPPKRQEADAAGGTALSEVADEPAMAEGQQYLDLHNKICGRAFSSRVQQALASIVEAISQALFINVDHVVKGGSVGKGTAINGLTDAEVVFFVHGLPQVGHDRWLPPLLRAAAGVLVEQLGGDRTMEGIHTTEDSVKLFAKGLVTVDVKFSPVFASYAQTVQVLGEQGPEARRLYGSSLVEQRTQFISRQSSGVKVTIRLLKWWRDQQEWSNKLVRPTDEILELMAVYSAVQTRPSDQRQAIANVMSLLARFDELRIVWSNYYNKEDVWAPLLRQRPLLMDPVNPFVNIAEPQVFDARELMSIAASTHFFW